MDLYSPLSAQASYLDSYKQFSFIAKNALPSLIA